MKKSIDLHAQCVRSTAVRDTLIDNPTFRSFRLLRAGAFNTLDALLTKSERQATLIPPSRSFEQRHRRVSYRQSDRFAFNFALRARLVGRPWPPLGSSKQLEEIGVCGRVLCSVDKKFHIEKE